MCIYIYTHIFPLFPVAISRCVDIDVSPQHWDLHNGHCKAILLKLQAELLSQSLCSAMRSTLAGLSGSSASSHMIPFARGPRIPTKCAKLWLLFAASLSISIFIAMSGVYESTPWPCLPNAGNSRFARAVGLARITCIMDAASVEKSGCARSFLPPAKPQKINPGWPLRSPSHLLATTHKLDLHPSNVAT